MPIINGQLTIRGAVVDILVSVSRNRRDDLQRLGIAEPERVSLRAEVDTGAGFTVIAPWVFERLGLQPDGRVRFLTPSTGPTPHECDQYLASVILVGPGNRLQFPSVRVAASEFPATDEVQAVLGRDLLGDCLLVYNGPAGAFALSF